MLPGGTVKAVTNHSKLVDFCTITVEAFMLRADFPVPSVAMVVTLLVCLDSNCSPTILKRIPNTNVPTVVYRLPPMMNYGFIPTHTFMMFDRGGAPGPTVASTH